MPMILHATPFPDEGCEQAFNCGKEFVLAQADPMLLPKALSFCETNMERVWFLRGMETEVLDAMEAV